MSLPHMVSYAQNGEDVVLRRVFHGQESGFWIDIGACDPELDSVTQHFFLNGWTGINVEPDATLYEKFVTARPTDINIRAAIAGDSQGRRFYPTGTRGHGTLVQEIAEDRVPNDSYSVPSIPLAELIDRYAPPGTYDRFSEDRRRRIRNGRRFVW